MKNDEQVRTLVHSAFDKGLAHVEDRPSLRYEIMKKARGEQKVKKKFSVAMVCAMVVLMTTTVALAAGVHLGVFDFMTNLFGQDTVLPQAQELVTSDLAVMELENTTLKVEEAVYDGGNLRVVYSVASNNESQTIEEAALADRVSLNGCDWFLINDEEIVMTNGSYFGNLLSPEEDRMLCYMDIYLASSNIVLQEEFKVSLPLIGSGKDAEYATFTVPGYDVAENLVKTKTDSVNVTLLSSSISPVRTYARLRIERLPDVSAESYEAALYDWQDAYLVDKQGTKLSAPVEILVDGSVDGEWIEQTYVFPPVEADEIYFASTVITTQDEWIVDMNHALQIK